MDYGNWEEVEKQALGRKYVDKQLGFSCRRTLIIVIIIDRLVVKEQI
jgi:hypothetical protein